MVVTKSLPLDSDHFNFDLTQGFEMAVEKDWNVLDFTDLNDQLTIYDADLRPMQPSKYGVRIFYKACIPMCYVDPENYPDNPLVKTADNASFRGKYLDLIDGTVLGSPVNKMSQGSTSEQSYGEFGYHGLLISDDVPTTKSAYALPDDRALNHTNVAKWAFAGGSSLASCKVNGEYYQPKDISLYTENVMGFAYMLMNKGGYNAGGVASFIVNNGALAYSVDTSANRFNLPTDDDHVENNKYLQPALFVPFGVAFADHLTINDQETPVDTAGWFYCVLGVNEVGGEDPSYQIDPQLIRLSDGEGLQIDPVAETYSYSDDISATSGTFGIEVADYCEIVSITLNDSSLVVPSPVNNVYSVSFSDLTAGDNSLVVVTQDENEQSLTYTFTLTYTAPTPPTPTYPPLDVHLKTNSQNQNKWDVTIEKDDLLDKNTEFTVCYFDWCKMVDDEPVVWLSDFTIETTDWDPIQTITLPSEIVIQESKSDIEDCGYLKIYFRNDLIDPSLEINPHIYELNKIYDDVPQTIPYELTTGDSTPNSGTISLSSTEYNNYTLVHLTESGASPNDYNFNAPSSLNLRVKTATQPYGFKLFPNSSNPPTLGDTITCTMVDKSDSSITQDIILTVVS